VLRWTNQKKLMYMNKTRGACT